MSAAPQRCCEAARGWKLSLAMGLPTRFARRRNQPNLSALVHLSKKVVSKDFKALISVKNCYVSEADGKLRQFLVLTSKYVQQNLRNSNKLRKS